MSSIQFNYFADEQGEQIIRQELLKKFGSLYVRDYFGKKESIIKEIEEFPSAPLLYFLSSQSNLLHKENRTSLKVLVL